MSKLQLPLSPEDFILLNRAKRTCVINIGIWIFLLLAMCGVIYIAVFPTFYLTESDKVTIIILFLFLGLLPLYGILHFAKILSIITTTIKSNSKNVLQVSTLPSFNADDKSAKSFFVNDNTQYNLNMINNGPLSVSLKKVTFLAENKMVNAEIAAPFDILLKYEVIENNKPGPGYITTVQPLTKADRGIMLKTISVFLKITNFVIFPLLMLVFCFASNFEWRLIRDYTLGIWIVFFLLANASLLCWWILVKKQLRNPCKIVVTGVITDIIEQKGKYPRLDFFLGLEKFNITTGEVVKNFSIGENIALHYMLKKNEKRGTLIKVEKLS
jgi:hypothetical protein